MSRNARQILDFAESEDADRGQDPDGSVGAPILRFTGVGMRYGRAPETLSDISFSLPPGSFHFLTGPSGAGKSSLLKLIYLDERPSRGLIHLFGRDLPMVHGLVLLLQIAGWGMKVITFCWLQLIIRWTFPRFRPDQLMRLGWKQLLPISLANILVTAGVVLVLEAGGR